MKYLVSQLAHFIKPATQRRNIGLLFRFLLLLVAMVIVFSILFHVLMQAEGRDHSWLTGVYWTLTVMSTLGFGDITFTGDLGRLFSVVVLLSGMFFLLVLLPFTFIEFFYAPWMKAQAEFRAPRELPASMSGHVILTHYDPVSAALIHKLTDYGRPYALLIPDLDQALRMHDLGFNVMFGEVDRPETYQLARVNRSALVAATGSDVVNTNIAFTVRELSKAVPIVTTALSRDSVDILQLAGSSQVIHLSEMMGQALARRIIGVDARAHIIGEFQELLIAEATAAGTPLAGKTLVESRIRENTGANVIGLWKRGLFEPAVAESRIDATTVLLLAGSADQLRRYDELFCIYHVSGEPVMIIGGGAVGSATARALASREVDYRIIEMAPERIRSDGKHILGSAADLATLESAGIQKSPAVVITTREDDTSIYLTIYCRRLRPDIQILSRATRERNVSTLHRAGADFVLSYASMGATGIFNYMRQASILMLAEGLHAAETQVPHSLAGKSLAESGITRDTQCTVVAIRTSECLAINPRPNIQLTRGATLILMCTPESEARFLERYGPEKIQRQPISDPEEVLS